MNKVLLVGTMVRDPELKTGNTSFTRFSIAVQRDFKDKDGSYSADFPNCVAFGKTAEFVCKYFSKGSKIGIVGHIQTGSYTDKNNSKVYTTDVMVEKVEFVGGKAEAKNDDFVAVPDKVEDMPFE